MLVLIRRVKSHSIKRVYVVTPQRNKDWGRSTVTAFSTKPPNPPKAGTFVCVCVERGGREERRPRRLERARTQSSPVWTDLGKQQERLAGHSRHHIHRPQKAYLPQKHCLHPPPIILLGVLPVPFSCPFVIIYPYDFS